MFDVITFGSATWDIFVEDEEIRLKRGELSLPSGLKIELDEARFFVGGGGINSLATFLAQGLKATYCGSVGADPMGEEILLDIEKMGAENSFVSKLKGKKTNLSVIFSMKDGDRTLLAYRGASELFLAKEILSKLPPASWFYIAPLSGEAIRSFEEIVGFAHLRGIKVAANLGNEQLRMSLERLREVLAKTDILILNEEEAALLVGESKTDVLFKKIADSYSGTFVMTRGEEGALVSSGNHYYKAGVIKTNIIDKTGAGDAFGAGFVSTLISGGSVLEAIQFATANAASCIEEWGAKSKLIKRGEEYQKVEVKKER